MNEKRQAVSCIKANLKKKMFKSTREMFQCKVSQHEKESTFGRGDKALLDLRGKKESGWGWSFREPSYRREKALLGGLGEKRGSPDFGQIAGMTRVKKGNAKGSFLHIITFPGVLQKDLENQL